MGKSLYVILGNGFTIDLIYFLRENSNLAHDIDVGNFFKYGAEVIYPETNEPGFLSSKHCPNLWNLGARPGMDAKEALEIIENIITSVNVYASHPRKAELAKSKQNDIYFFAYLELIEYIRNLFVLYDKKIKYFPNKIRDWSWFKFLKSASKHYDKIYIVTYNYDVWMERIFDKMGIKYSIYGLSGQEEAESSIIIFKPHGSISFLHNLTREPSEYRIDTQKEIKNLPIQDYSLDYSFEKISRTNAIIPPASEAGRMQQEDNSWSKTIHNAVIEQFKQSQDTDDCVISGISYWHVDRNEIDNIIVNLNSKISLKMINPNAPKSLIAVLTSLFDNFVLYPKSNILERIIKND